MKKELSFALTLAVAQCDLSGSLRAEEALPSAKPCQTSCTDAQKEGFEEIQALFATARMKVVGIVSGDHLIAFTTEKGDPTAIALDGDAGVAPCIILEDGAMCRLDQTFPLEDYIRETREEIQRHKVLNSTGL